MRPANNIHALATMTVLTILPGVNVCPDDNRAVNGVSAVQREVECRNLAGPAGCGLQVSVPKLDSGAM